MSQVFPQQKNLILQSKLWAVNKVVSSEDLIKKSYMHFKDLKLTEFKDFSHSMQKLNSLKCDN